MSSIQIFIGIFTLIGLCWLIFSSASFIRFHLRLIGKIFFIPVIGSVIYIITQVYNKNDADKIQDEITSIINPTKKIRDLEKKIAIQ